MAPVIPNEFLSDLKLFVGRGDEVSAYVSLVAYDSILDQYSLEFRSSASNTLLISGTVPRLNIDTTSKAFQKQMLSSGGRICLFKPGPIWSDSTWNGQNPSGSWSLPFVSGTTDIESSLISSGPRGLRRVIITNPDTQTEGIRNGTTASASGTYTLAVEGFFTIHILSDDDGLSAVSYVYSSPDSLGNFSPVLLTPVDPYNIDIPLNTWDVGLSSFSVVSGFAVKFQRTGARLLAGQKFKVMALAPSNLWSEDRAITLRAGYNMQAQIGLDSNTATEAFLQVSTDAPENLTLTIEREAQRTLLLSCVPGQGLGALPAELADSSDYIKTIQGVTPDERGNINLEGADCLRVVSPSLGAGVVPSSVQILSDCLPCCGCENYLHTARAIGRRSAKLKDAANRLQNAINGVQSGYNAAVTNLNKGKSSIISCMGTRINDSTIVIPVFNTSDVPVIAFVAVQYSGHPVPSGYPVVFNTPWADEINTTSFGDAHSAINSAAGLTPPMAATKYDLQGPPGNPFPSTYFSAPISRIYRVGSTSPTTPIGPGGNSILRLNFNLATSESLRVDGGSLVIRSCCIFGANKRYPLRSETLTISLEDVGTVSLPDVVQKVVRQS